MSNPTMNVVKGVAVGMAAGALAGYLGKKMMSSGRKTLKKKANRALKEMGSMMDTASYMFR